MLTIVNGDHLCVGVARVAEIVDGKATRSQSNKQRDTVGYQSTDVYKELKVGKLAQVVFRKMLEEGAASEDEVLAMQQAEYSKQVFDLNYPLLAKLGTEYDAVRYYVKPLTIRGVEYLMCSQWFETAANNDRPYLVRWIQAHQKNEEILWVLRTGVLPEISGKTPVLTNGFEIDMRNVKKYFFLLV